MKILIAIGLIGLVAILLVFISRESKPSNMSKASLPFKMPIDDTFGLKTKGWAVVVGVVSSGRVETGDALVIKLADSELPATVEALESFHKNIRSARKGDRIGVMLSGVDKKRIVLPATLESVEN